MLTSIFLDSSSEWCQRFFMEHQRFTVQSAKPSQIRYNLNTLKSHLIPFRPRTESATLRFRETSSIRNQFLRDLTFLNSKIKATFFLKDYEGVSFKI